MLANTIIIETFPISEKNQTINNHFFSISIFVLQLHEHTFNTVNYLINALKEHSILTPLITFSKVCPNTLAFSMNFLVVCHERISIQYIKA